MKKIKEKQYSLFWILTIAYLFIGLFIIIIPKYFNIPNYVVSGITVISIGIALASMAQAIKQDKDNEDENKKINDKLNKIINTITTNDMQASEILANINEYIKVRIDDQIEYYDKKSIHYKKMHENLTITTIILSASIAIIPAFTALIPNYKNTFTFLSAFFAAIITVLQTIDKLKKYNELFYQYRSTCEKLKQEKYLFLTNSGEYKTSHNAPTNEQLLVERCESIMATENGTWAQLNEKKKD